MCDTVGKGGGVRGGGVVTMLSINHKLKVEKGSFILLRIAQTLMLTWVNVAVFQGSVSVYFSPPSFFIKYLQ